MLVKITDSALSDTDKINAAILRDWSAVDLETGAYLLGSRGLAKYGNAPRWFLILPHDGKLPLRAEDGRGDYERAIFRAESLGQAIATGNEKLPKLIAKRNKKFPDCDHPFRVTGETCLNCGELDTAATK